MIKESVLVPEIYLEKFTAYCSLWNYRDQSSECWHHHDFDELVVVCSGEGVHVTENGAYPVQRGDVFLIPYGASHKYAELKKFSIANLIFHLNDWRGKWKDLADSVGYNILFENNNIIQEKYRFSNRLTLASSELTKCEMIFSGMQMEQASLHSGCSAMNEALFMQLCIMLCREFSRLEHKQFSEISDLTLLLEFIQNNYAEPLTLNDLANKCNRSVSSLTRLFRTAMNMSPIEYLNMIRLDNAAKALREGAVSISSIAFSHGFTDSNYFSIRFSRYFGYSPREYRNKWKQKELC